jgi:thioredoxin 1
MSEIIPLSEQNWENEIINSNLPVVVDFWAEWCAPCRMMAPILEEIAQEYQGKIKVGKLNVDENSTIAGQYHIMGIPTLLFFRNGKLVDKVVGIVPRKTLDDKIEKLFKEGV